MFHSPFPSSSKKKSKPKFGKVSRPPPARLCTWGTLGYDAEKGFTSRGIDPSWTTFLASLEAGGVSKEVTEKNMDFIKDFARQYQDPHADRLLLHVYQRRLQKHPRHNLIRPHFNLNDTKAQNW
ncbi:hypothetical protein C0995_001418, partial [Termitomyces sp. Mi166